jgi:hypothetical protein
MFRCLNYVAGMVNCLMVNRFECVLAALRHEEPSVVPQVVEFTNEMARTKFVPLMKKRGLDVKRDSEAARSVTPERVVTWYREALKEAEFLDTFIVGVGSGGFRVKSRVKADSERFLDEWETGAVWRVGSSKTTWVREYVKYPVECEDDLGGLVLPDPDDSRRYEGFEESMKYVVERGFFPVCGINGFFSGVWYFLRGPLYVVLRDLYFNRRLFEKLIEKVGEFNLRAERNLLERGAMMINWVDDLGYNKGTFMNPELYEKLIFPWHKKAIELAHRYGAFVNMHSHGNINAVVPLLVEAGLDVLNPVGPSDNMDLAVLKKLFGDHLCLQGGLSKHIGFMNNKELRQHIVDRLRIGSPGGGFILSSEGSLPYEMSENHFLAFVKLSRKYRRNVPS